MKQIVIMLLALLAVTVPTAAYASEDEEAAREPSPNPYCDLVDMSRLAPDQSCFDRKDYDAETGLYPCRDWTYKEDWRDCD